jgi:hypothetical protein
VEHADNLVLLDHEPNLINVRCEKQLVVVLEFTAAEVVPAIAPDHLLAGGRHHCDNGVVLLRRVVAVKQPGDNTLILSTKEAEYHEFFNGDISFQTNMVSSLCRECHLSFTIYFFSVPRRPL